MQTNIVGKGKQALTNDVQGQGGFVGGFAGGPDVGTGIEKDTLKQAKEKKKQQQNFLFWSKLRFWSPWVFQKCWQQTMLIQILKSSKMKVQLTSKQKL